MNLNEKKKKRINKRKRMREKEILTCALKVLSEKGIEQSNMTEVAKASEVGVATLYRYFENKTNLVIKTGVQAWDEIHVKYKETIELICNDEAIAIVKLENLLNLFYKIFTKEENFVCFLDGFDNYMMNNNVSTDLLDDYENEILKIDPYIHRIYKEGVVDHTIKEITDIDLFIKTVGHTLLALAQKAHIRNQILKSDKKERLMDEMKLMIEMVIYYAKK